MRPRLRPPRRADAERRRRSDATTAISVAWSLGLALLGLVAISASVFDRSIGYFTRDPAQVLDGAAYVGAVSNAGAVLWATSAASCLLATMVLGPRRSWPLVWGGVISTAFLLDDVFLMHEAYFGLVGIVENSYALLYGAGVVVYAATFRSFLRANDGWVFIAALGLLAFSGLVDIFYDDRSYLVEDGAKLLGAIAWTVFFVFACRDELQRDARSGARRMAARPNEPSQPIDRS